MKKIGMLGGMSWESTVLYYQIMNRRVRKVVGGHHSLPCVIHSVDGTTVNDLQIKGDWDTAAQILADAASGLKAAGAEAIMICCNTMHICASAIEAQTQLPFLHIVDLTAQAVMNTGVPTVALFGTRYTMESQYFKGKLEKDYGMEVILPNQAGREEVHRIIYEELSLGIVRPDSRANLIDIINGALLQGAKGVILGCTELCMLVSQDDFLAPIFDTTTIHAEFAADWAISSH